MARTDTLSNFLSDVADAIRTKKGSEELIAAEDFDTEIENISGVSMPAMENDVMFYDYDGTVVYSYTKDKFLALEAMPTVPIHPGLTSIGWNWTLEELQDYVEKYGIGQTGATYIPTDGKTKVNIEINNAELNLYLGLGINGTVNVDWGDESNQDITGSSLSTTTFTEHIYNNPGKYTLIFTLTENSQISLNGAGSMGSGFLFSTTASSTNSKKRNHIVKSIIIGSNTRIGTIGLGYPNMEYVILPETYFVEGANYIATGLKALKVIIYPHEYTNNFAFNYGAENQMIRAMVFSPKNTTLPSGYLRNNLVARRFLPSPLTETIMQNQCISATALNIAVIPENVVDIRDAIFSGCTNLQKVIFNNSSKLTKTPDSFLSGCTSLTEFTFPPLIERIQPSCFNNCTNLSIVNCLNLSAVPTLDNINAFSNVSNDCKIIVPDDLYEDWIAAANWSTYADNIISKSDWDALQNA